MIDRVCKFLQNYNAEYKLLDSDDIQIPMLKTLLIKVGFEDFRLFVLRESDRISASNIKAYFGAKTIRFAEESEVAAQTSVTPKNLPPFGTPVIELSIFLDSKVQGDEAISFRLGENIVLLDTATYQRVSQAEVFDFTE